MYGKVLNKIMIDVAVLIWTLFLFQGLNIIFHVALALLKVSLFLSLNWEIFKLAFDSF